MEISLKKFSVDVSLLSKEDREVFDILSEAVALVVPLYAKQKNLAHEGGNFYSHDASRDEIQKAAENNPQILSPYTFVERDESGSLIAIPYHEKFKKELTEISSLLKKAASITLDGVMQAYLEARAKDLLQDTYEASNILWLKTESSTIGFVIGAFDRYHDRLFFEKRAYTGWIGILDQEWTEEIDLFKENVLASGQVYLLDAKEIRVSDVKIRVEDSAIVAGLDADFLFVSNNLPSSADISTVEKYGTMCTVFKPMVEWRFSNWIFPVFEALFAESRQGYLSKDELRTAFMRVSSFDEICHSLMRYGDATQRLQEILAYFDEMYGDILTVKAAMHLFARGVLSRKELEAVLVVELCQALYYITFSEKRAQLNSLAMGYTYLLSFLLEREGVRQTEKGFDVDIQKTLFLVEELAQNIEYHLAIASRVETKNFLERFQSQDLRRYIHSFLGDMPRDKE